MPRVRLRSQVPSDLEEIIDYLIEQGASAAASRFAAAAEHAMNDLAQMPGKGSPKHFRSKPLRPTTLPPPQKPRLISPSLSFHHCRIGSFEFVSYFVLRISDLTHSPDP